MITVGARTFTRPLVPRLPMPLPMLAFISALVLVNLRMPEAILRAEFYADDGALYTLALANGVGSVFEPLAGYFAVGHLAVVYLQTLLPPAFAPLLGSLVMSAAIAGVAAFATSSRMPWSPERGFLIAIGIAVLPASYPIIGNLAHLMWPVWLWVALTAVAREARWPRLEAGVLFVAGLTGPASVLLWPMFLRGPRVRLVAVGAAGLIQLALILIRDRATLLALDPPFIPYVVLVRGIVTPLLGPTIARDLEPIAVIVIGSVLFGSLGLTLLRNPLRWWIALLLVISPAAGILLAGAPTGWYANPDLFPRYFWIPSVGLIILIVLGWPRLVVVPLAAALLLGVVSEARIEPWPDMEWTYRSHCIGRERPCEVPVAPSPEWNVHWLPPVPTGEWRSG